MKKAHYTLIKVLISTSLLCYVFSLVGIQPIVENFLGADLLYVFFVLILCFLSLLISCFKWQRLLLLGDSYCSLRKLISLYLIGYFFNNFLPTSIGGDAARGYYLAKDTGQTLDAATSIFAERFSGLLALLPIGACGLWLTPAVVGGRQFGIIAAIILAGVAVAFVCGWFLRKRIERSESTLLQSLENFYSGLVKYVIHKKTLFMLVWTSFGFQILVIMVYYFSARALSLNISFMTLLAVVPLVTLLTLIPLSLNGLGLREGAFVFFLSQVGVNSQASLSLSLFVYTISLLFSLLGGIVFLFFRKVK